MKIKVAATQMRCDWEIENNLKKSINLIEKAAEQGANIILLQELFQSPYFWQNLGHLDPLINDDQYAA